MFLSVVGFLERELRGRHMPLRPRRRGQFDAGSEGGSSVGGPSRFKGASEERAQSGNARCDNDDVLLDQAPDHQGGYIVYWQPTV